MKFDCETCGKIDEVLMDGYSFGERILEGVKFKVKKNDDATCVVESVDDWDTDPYLRGLNEKHWMGAAKASAESEDFFECPTCHGDAIPDDMMVEEIV